MTPCISCELRLPASTLIPSMCVRCVRNLPQVTREMYKTGGLKVDRLVRLSKERNASVKALRGGR